MKKNLLKIIIILVFLVFGTFLRHYLSVFYFQNDLNRVAINVETNKNIENILVCFDSDCDFLQNNNNIYSYKLNQENPLFYKEVSSIELILNNKNDLKNIDDISLFYNNKVQKFDKNNLILKETEFNGEEKISLAIPFDTNSKTFLKKACVYFESLFYNWYFYFFGYILLIIYFSIYKDRFNFKIKNLIVPILLLGLILRLSHIDFIPLWNDELYTYTMISNCGSGLNLKNIFLDPGNPPLFFVLSNIWLLFFNKSVFLIRLLPCLLGVLLIYCVYFIVKKLLNKKTAIIASFLAAINIFIIVESNEIRSYVLSMILVILGGYSFYKLYLNFEKKNLILYSIVSFLLCICHYYCVLFVVFNFLLGLFLFKKQNKKFILSNIPAFLGFLFYFIVSYKNSLSQTFNTWIEKPTFDVLINHITFYFGNIFWFILTIAFVCFMLKKLSKLEKNIVLYSISSIVFVFIVSFVFSLLIKPILFERYFCIFLPLLIIVTSIFLSFEYDKKIKPFILVLILLFSINMPKYENFNLFSNIYYSVKYSTADYLRYKDDYDVYFIIPDYFEYINYFSNDFKNINKNNIIVSKKGIQEKYDIVKPIIDATSKKKVVIYLPEICTNSLIKEKYDTKKIATSILPIYKIFVVKL